MKTHGWKKKPLYTHMRCFVRSLHKVKVLIKRYHGYCGGCNRNMGTTCTEYQVSEIRGYHERRKHRYNHIRPLNENRPVAIVFCQRFYFAHDCNGNLGSFSTGLNSFPKYMPLDSWVSETTGKPEKEMFFLWFYKRLQSRRMVGKW